MANAPIKAERIAEGAALALEQAVSLAGTALTYRGITKDDFVGAKDDTYSLWLPAVLDADAVALRSADPVAFDEIEETKVDIVLDTWLRKGLKATTAELTLDIKPFMQRFVIPAMKSVAALADQKVADEFEDATPNETVDYTPGTDDPWEAALDASEVLDGSNVDIANRYILVGRTSKTDILKSKRFTAEIGGDAPATAATRQALIGEFAGLPVYSSNRLDPHAYFVGQQMAIATVFAAPDPIAGLPVSVLSSQSGIPVRYSQAGDINYMSDKLVVDTFFGGASVEQEIGGVTKNYRLVRVGTFGSEES